MTTAIAVEAAALALLEPGATILVVSVSERQAKLVLEQIRRLLAQVPGLTFAEQSKTALTLDTWDSRVVSLPNSPHTIRGYTADHVYIDEAAHFQNDQDVLVALQPSVARGGRLTLVSTPYGQRGEFYRIWTTGEGWSRHFIPWHRCPAYDDAWFAAMRPQFSAATWAQEFEGDFAESGAPVFAPAAIDAAIVDDLEWPAQAQDGRVYVTGADLARKADWTVIITLDTTEKPWRLVNFQRYQGKPWPVVVQDLEAEVGAYGSRLIVDSTGVGDPVHQYLSVPAEGYTFTARTKADLVQNLVLVLERGDLVLPPIDALTRELRVYQWQDQGLVQDCVMALALAAWEAAQDRAPVPVRAKAVANTTKRRRRR